MSKRPAPVTPMSADTFEAMMASKNAALGKRMDCDRKWPELDLFLPVNLRHYDDMIRKYEFMTMFYRSYVLFWNKFSNTSLNVLVDAEDADDYNAIELKKYTEQLRPQFPGPVRISLNQPSHFYKRGHDRQQRLMFWPDNFTTAEYVGFVDTDCVFVTYIDREDLFEDGKPVINGRSGNSGDHAWKWMPLGTYNALHILEPMRCMSYFPVIVKTAHFKSLRAYVERIHNTYFDDVFLHVFNNGSYSQFNIMCAYLFEFHRDEYVWYVHSETPDWDGVNPPPLPGQNGDLSKFTPEMYYPKPRVATHARYRNPKHESNIVKWPEAMNELLSRGMCLAPPLNRAPSVCNENSETSRDGYYNEQFRFEYFDWSLHHLSRPGNLTAVHQARINRFAHCNHTISEEAMKPLLHPYDYGTRRLQQLRNDRRMLLSESSVGNDFFSSLGLFDAADRSIFTDNNWMILIIGLIGLLAIAFVRSHWK